MTVDDRKLRILHVTEVHWGGVVTLLKHFVAEQVADGHEVHVLAHPDLPDLAPEVDVHRWDIDRGKPASFLKAVRQLRALVAELAPDVIHLHSYFAGFLGRLPFNGKLGGAAVVYQPHAWSDNLFAGRLASTAIERSERLSARRTDLIVANCGDELRRGEQLGVHVAGRAIGVAVDLTTFRPPTAEERAQARHELGIGDNRLALVLGRLARQKGQDLLLPVWAADPPPGTTLALVGPGDRDWAAGFAGAEWEGSVIAPGGTDDVLPWLRAADVLVLCSRYETVALVVAEAMSVGLPVVATAVDGAREVLLEGPEPAAGAVVETPDMAGLVRELSRRLDDADLHARESAAGPVRALERFAPEAVTRRLVDAYREAIQRAHPTETR
jgi:glycosyltransferase involved in cell wall biosynthesis